MPGREEEVSLLTADYSCADSRAHRRRNPIGDGHDPFSPTSHNNNSGKEDDSDSDVQRALEDLQSRDAQHTARVLRLRTHLRALWGPAPPYTSQPEDSAAFLIGGLYYTWIGGLIRRATAEDLSEADLPRPVQMSRGFDSGAVLSRALQRQRAAFHAWDSYIGARVVRVSCAAAEGTLRWVGLAPELKSKKKALALCAGVEWSDDAPVEGALLHDGEVAGERLFQTATGRANATCERVSDIRIAFPHKGEKEPCGSRKGPNASGKSRPMALPESAKRAPAQMSVARAVFAALGYHIYLIIPARLVRDAALLASPVVVQTYIEYLSSPDPTWRDGIALVVVFLLLGLVRSAADSKLSQLSTRAGLTLRSALQAVLFEKCATVSPKALAHPDMSVGRLVNMVSHDADVAQKFPALLLIAFCAPLQLVVSLALLYRLVGWCAFAGLGAIAVFMPLQGILMRRVQGYYAAMSIATDARLKTTNEFLSSMRVAKFMCWEPALIREIEVKRRLELGAVRSAQHAFTLMSFLADAIPGFSVAVILVLYHTQGHELTPAIVFPTIALMGIMQMPFVMVPVSLISVVRFLVAMKRITKFVESDDVEDMLNNPRPALEDSAKGTDDGSNDNDKNKTYAAEFIDASIAVYTARHIPDITANASSDPTSPPPHTEEESAPAPADSDHKEGHKEGHKEDKENGRYVVEPKVLLHGVNLRLPRGGLTCVVGDTGCGKSTLLDALLSGAAVITKGTVRFPRAVAHVPQQPWIMNATLAENILFFDPSPSASRLARALRCTQLEADLSLLPRGAETEIGERGVTLSGGQKARVGLARAVYTALGQERSAQDLVVVLDDPLAALDAGVGRRVLQECILGELRGTTRVLATHHLHVLRHADYIVMLRAGGTVEFAGSYAEYEQFSSTGHEYTNEGDNANGKREFQDTDGSEMTQKPEKKKTGNFIIDEDDSDDSKNTLKTLKAQNNKTIENKEGGGDDDNNDKARLILDEEKATGAVKFSTYRKYMESSGGISIWVLLIILFTVTELTVISPSLWLSFWSVRTFPLSANTYLFVYIGCVAANALSNPLRSLSSYAVMRRAAYQLHGGMLRSIAVAPVTFFDQTPIGRVMNRFSRDVERIDWDLQTSVISFVQCLLTVISSFAVMASSQYFVLLAIVPSALIYYKLMLFYRSANRETRRIANRANSPIFSVLGEALSGRWTIAAYGKASSIMKQALRHIDTAFSSTYVQTVCNCWLAVRVDLLSNLVLTVVALLGVLLVMLHFAPVNVGLISLSLTMAIQLNTNLTKLVNCSATAEADMNCVERIQYYTHNIEHEDLLKDINEVIEQEDAAEAERKKNAKSHKKKKSNKDSGKSNRGDHLSGDNENVDTASLSLLVDGENNEHNNDPHTSVVHFTRSEVSAGSLEFRDVQMRYREGLPLVLNGVSFVIQPSQKVGIVGRTGSGKSSLLLAFMRIVETCGGDIFVSGRPIRSYGLRELRQLFSMIPQDPVLFNGTLRFNLDPLNESTDEEVWHAVGLVGMRERVVAGGSGLQSRVEEGGANFSVGQRQLLCMARTLLRRRCGFILMDEATANVDPTLDRQIQHTVRHSFATHTVVTIAHRLHTVAAYDMILVMEAGRVVEVGAPRELARRADSRLAEMVRSHGEGALEEFIRAAEE